MLKKNNVIFFWFSDAYSGQWKYCYLKLVTGSWRKLFFSLFCWSLMLFKTNVLGVVSVVLDQSHCVHTAGTQTVFWSLKTLFSYLTLSSTVDVLAFKCSKCKTWCSSLLNLFFFFELGEHFPSEKMWAENGCMMSQYPAYRHGHIVPPVYEYLLSIIFNSIEAWKTDKSILGA